MQMRMVIAAAGAAALLLGAAAGQAQTIRGRVVAEESERPIVRAEVRMLTPQGREVARAITSDAGTFVVQTNTAGAYRLETSVIGYATTTSRDIDLAAGETVDVVVRLAPQGVPLNPITVRAAATGRERGRDLFARRCLDSGGICLDQDSIAALPAVYATDLFEELDGVYVDYRPGGGFIHSTRGYGCMLVFLNGQLMPLQLNTRANNTMPAVGVQRTEDLGMRPLGTGAGRQRMGYIGTNREGLSLDEIAPSEIRGIEIYRSYREVPEELKGGLTGASLWPDGFIGPCGAAVVWTQHEWGGNEPRVTVVNRHLWRGARVHATLSSYTVSGRFSPGTGVALEAAPHWRTGLHPKLTIGLLLRRNVHQISAATTAALTRSLREADYVPPTGGLTLAMWTAGVEPRFQLADGGRLEPYVGARLQAARRSFSVQRNVAGFPDVSVISLGWGLGLTAGAWYRLNERTALTGELGQDWLRFRGYSLLEQSWHRTGGTWGGTALRVGVDYALGR